MKTKSRHLLVKYIQRPKDSTKTSIKGYMSDEKNQQWDEAVEFSVGLRKNDIIKYNVILDMDKKIVIKNNMGGESQWQPIWDYYYKNYSKQIEQYLARTKSLV